MLERVPLFPLALLACALWNDVEIERGLLVDAVRVCADPDVLQAQRVTACTWAIERRIGRGAALAELLAYRGHAHSQAGDRAASLLDYQASLRTRSGHARALAGLAELMAEEGRFEEASRIADGLISDRLMLAAAYRLRGDYLQSVGEHGSALLAYYSAFGASERHGGDVSLRGIPSRALASDYRLGAVFWPFGPIRSEHEHDDDRDWLRIRAVLSIAQLQERLGWRNDALAYYLHATHYSGSSEPSHPRGIAAVYDFMGELYQFMEFVIRDFWGLGDDPYQVRVAEPRPRYSHDRLRAAAYAPACWSALQAEGERGYGRAHSYVDDADSYANVGLQLDPLSPELLMCQGVVQLRYGHGPSALETLHTALQLDRGNATALYGAGLARLLNGACREGWEVMALATEFDQDIAARFAEFGLPSDSGRLLYAMNRCGGWRQWRCNRDFWRRLR